MSGIQPGCTVTLRRDGKLENIRTKDSCIINHVVPGSMEFKQDLDEIKNGYRRLKLELYIREEDIIKLIDLGTGTMEQSAKPIPKWAELL